MEFTQYVHQQRPALIRFATMLSGDPWLADDVVSDVLGRAYERWSRIDAVDNPHAYVRRMVVNDFLSWRRRFGRIVPRAQVDVDTTSPDTGASHAERDAMRQRLDTLPPRQRAAVVLRFYADLPDDEIAEHLGCRPATVRSLVFRALQTLRIDEPAASHPRVLNPARPSASRET